MTFQCERSICAITYHPRDMAHGRHYCDCGGRIARLEGLLIEALQGGKVVGQWNFKPQQLIKVGRASRGSIFNQPDINLKPLISNGKSVSRDHLSLRLNEDGQVRLSVNSKHVPIVVNRRTFSHGDLTYLETPFQVHLTPDLILNVKDH